MTALMSVLINTESIQYEVILVPFLRDTEGQAAVIIGSSKVKDPAWVLNQNYLMIRNKFITNVVKLVDDVINLVMWDFMRHVQLVWQGGFPATLRVFD